MDSGHAAGRTLQRLPGDDHLGIGRARQVDRRGDERDGTPCTETSRRVCLRMDRHLLRGEAIRGTDWPAARTVARSGLPAAVRTLRELDRTDRRAAGRAAWCARRSAVVD